MSLLNDEMRSTTLNPSRHSTMRQLSLRSTPPTTPELSRSHSWSSRRSTESPPPRTPVDALDAVPAAASSSAILGSPIDEMMERAPSPSTPGSPLTVSVKPMPKRYACQFADKLDCREMFTTSGHASRHAKKHTGEKNVPCPRCMKRFARKDNMKQHLKTHEAGRSIDLVAERVEGPRAVKMQKLCDRMRKRAGTPLSPIRTDMSSMSASADPPASSTSSSTLAQCTGRPPLRRASATHYVPRRASAAYLSSASVSIPSAVEPPRSSSSSSSSFSTLLTPGLDALVLAADATSMW